MKFTLGFETKCLMLTVLCGPEVPVDVQAASKKEPIVTQSSEFSTAMILAKLVANHRGSTGLNALPEHLAHFQPATTKSFSSGLHIPSVLCRSRDD